MTRKSSSLTGLVAIAIASVLVASTLSSANNLRSINETKRRNGRGIGSNLPTDHGKANADNAYQNFPVNLPMYRIDQEEREFFNDLLQQMSSFEDTPDPTVGPTKRPTIKPTRKPTKTPTGQPSSSPTPAPTASPTKEPTPEPSSSPTITRSGSPTADPSKAPTVAPTVAPSAPPTAQPSAAPTVTESGAPTRAPSGAPSGAPVETPSMSPTTQSPTRAPSAAPVAPTMAPVAPTMAPVSPTPSPVALPTPSPVALSTPSPTTGPTLRCNLTEDGRVALINIFLRVVSNPADVDTPGSPQALALNWVIFEDPMQVCPQDQNLIQRYVMAVFYFSTRGDRWTECSAPPPLMDVEDPEQAVATANANCGLRVAGFQSNNNAWLTGGTECQWGGLGCNEENFVTRIEMEQNGIAGTLPHELSRLQTLRNLILEEGILTGTIPSELGEIRSLEQIDLNFNLLQGSIPEELYLLSNLRQMDLNDNELTGTISSGISGLSRMSFFQIENNIFTGTVPNAFGALTGLEVATMDNNQLSGTMPCGFMNTRGTLKVLTSDCLGAPNRPSPPLLICDCCTQCF